MGQIPSFFSLQGSPLLRSSSGASPGRPLAASRNLAASAGVIGTGYGFPCFFPLRFPLPPQAEGDIINLGRMGSSSQRSRIFKRTS